MAWDKISIVCFVQGSGSGMMQKHQDQGNTIIEVSSVSCMRGFQTHLPTLFTSIDIKTLWKLNCRQLFIEILGLSSVNTPTIMVGFTLRSTMLKDYLAL